MREKPAQRAMFGSPQHACNQKTGEHKEHVHAHPQEFEMERVMEEDRQDRQSAHAVQLWDSLHRVGYAAFPAYQLIVATCSEALRVTAEINPHLPALYPDGHEIINSSYRRAGAPRSCEHRCTRNLR